MCGSVLTRIASSHIRVGTFQYLPRVGDTEGVRQLAEPRHRQTLSWKLCRCRAPLSRAIARRDRAERSWPPAGSAWVINGS